MKKNIKIALIDSDIDSRFQEQVVSGVCILYDENKNSVYLSDDYTDENGHGTYCAQIITSHCKHIEFIIIKILDQNNIGYDDSKIIKVIKDFLEMENYNIYVAEDGKTALALLGKKIDLIILDINLPDIDGIELCKKVRNYLNVPIIFLSARIEESDKIIGLRAGGDDYIIKPFSLGELQARIEAHLRRERKKHDRRKVYSDGKLWIDYKEKKIFYNECLIGLTKSEFMIVELLSNYPTQIFDREMIYEKLWGFDKEGDNRMVTEFISRIRRKIKKFTDYEYIETVWGCGYKWNERK